MMDALLSAECLVATLGVPHVLKPRPKAPTKAQTSAADKMPETIRKRVVEFVDTTSQGKQSEPPELPGYRETNDALIDGLNFDELTDVLLTTPMESQPACSLTLSRAVEYLRSLFPRRVEQRLTGPYMHDPSPGEWAEFGWAWRIAGSPLTVLDLASDGMLIGVEVKHLREMFPTIYSEICGDILDALADKAAADKDWMAPWWLQKQICTILGISPVSPTLVADIDAAVKQSQAETKTRASALKLSQTGATGPQKLADGE